MRARKPRARLAAIRTGLWARVAAAGIAREQVTDCPAAEFRGPGMHHRFDDSPDDYEMDMDQRTRMFGGAAGGGRIILLGDGTEIATDRFSDDDGDVDMEDSGQAEELEDKDLEEQVKKGHADAKPKASDVPAEERSQREETPGPQKPGAAESTEAAAAAAATEGKEKNPDSSDQPPPPQTTEKPLAEPAANAVDSKPVSEEKSFEPSK